MDLQSPRLQPQPRPHLPATATTSTSPHLLLPCKIPCRRNVLAVRTCRLHYGIPSARGTGILSERTVRIGPCRATNFSGYPQKSLPHREIAKARSGTRDSNNVRRLLLANECSHHFRAQRDLHGVHNSDCQLPTPRIKASLAVPVTATDMAHGISSGISVVCRKYVGKDAEGVRKPRSARDFLFRFLCAHLHGACLVVVLLLLPLPNHSLTNLMVRHCLYGDECWRPVMRTFWSELYFIEVLHI